MSRVKVRDVGCPSSLWQSESETSGGYVRMRIDVPTVAVGRVGVAVNYLSTDGAHGFGSAPEQARAAKNNVIEWSLLIVGRL